MRLLVLVLFSAVCSFSFGQHDNSCLTEAEFTSILNSCFSGSADLRTNQNRKVLSPNGACKIAFMNIQHRLAGRRVEVDDKETQTRALNMSTFHDAFYDSTQWGGPILIPLNGKDSVSLKDFEMSDSVDVGIVRFVKDSLLNRCDKGLIAFSVGAGFHLFHLAYQKEEGKVLWFLFDDFGLNGEYHKDFWDPKSLALTAEQVRDYLRKYVRGAALVYARSPNLLNPTQVYCRTWEAGDRPLLSEVYVYKK